MTQQLITREKFKKIKKMDRREVETFVFNLYQEAFMDGYEKGKTTAPSIDLDELQERLLGMKGIGKVKAEAILGIIKESMEKRNRDEGN